MLRALLCVCLLTAAGCRAPVDLAPNQQPEQESGVSTATAPAGDATPSPENRVPIVWWTVPQFAPGAESDAPWALDDVLEAFGQANPGLELDVRVRPAHGADGIARHALATQRAAPAALPDLVALPLDVLADDELRSWVTARWDDMATEELQGLYPFAAASVTDVSGDAVALPFAVDVMHLASRSSDAVEAWSLVESAGPAGPYILPYPEADCRALSPILDLGVAAARATSALDADDAELLEPALAAFFSAVRSGRVELPEAGSDTAATAWERHRSGIGSGAVASAAALLRDPAGTAGLAWGPPTAPDRPASVGCGWALVITSTDPERTEGAARLGRWLVAPPNGDWILAAGYLPAAREQWPSSIDRSAVDGANPEYLAFVQDQLESAVGVAGSIGWAEALAASAAAGLAPESSAGAMAPTP